jgi:hypothetical protein
MASLGTGLEGPAKKIKNFRQKSGNAEVGLIGERQGQGKGIAIGSIY